MVVHTPTAESGSRETASPYCDLDWLKATKSPVVTRTQAAEIFGIDERTITRGVEEGSIPSIRVGRRMLIPTLALRRLLGIEERA